jgi:hypothetical protein
MEFSPALLDQLRAGMPLTVVGHTPLPGRRGRLVVMARSDGQKVHLAATFVGAVRRPTGDERPFAFARGPLGQLVLFAGLWPPLVPLLGPRAEALKVEALPLGAPRFCDLVELTAGGTVPLSLTPEGHRVDTVLESLGRFLSRRWPRGARGGQPGRVYQPPAAGDDAVGLADVGGQEAAKAELETICLAVRDPSAFAAWGARPPKGVLLYGPPGTGKTLLARALAHDARARFIHVRATDVVSKWYGEAERKLQEAFDWAQRERPSVLFFDEIDAIAPEREGAHEATHRMVTTFLENLDGLHAAEGIVVVAATNRAGSVDPALLRAGRLDRLIEVPMPDRDSRRAIFDIHLARAGRKAGRVLFERPSGEDWDRLLDASEGLSGADIAEAVRHCLEAKVRSGATGGRITADELLAETFAARRPF